VPVLDADVSRRGMVIRSFTSLHRAGKTGEGSTFATELPRAEDEEMPVPSASNLGAETAEADPLRGAVFGEIVHGVLEKIDYEAVGQAAEPELLLADESATEKVLAGEIDQYLPQLSSRLPVEELRSLCRERVAQLVWHALHTPLPDVGPLWKIPAQDRLVELSFHFPEFEGTPSAYGGGSSIHGEENFLTGFIDVVLRHGGRYFLVDWKTNALPGYGSVDVARAMEEGDYVLQYRLYLQALVRWLRRSLGPTFDWTRDLGGVYYLFLRGLGGAAGDGVFFHKPTAEDLRLDHVLRTRRSGGN
jgi:exodeoxyribonuclease V beta subunit